MYTDQQRRGHIRELQRFLRRIQQARGETNPVVPDGIYGPETAAAVRQFQRRNGLPVTGTADFDTWMRIYSQFLAASAGDPLPGPVAFFPVGADTVLSPGDKGAPVFALQLVLNTAVPHYIGILPIPLTGEYDSDTAGAVRRFQSAFQLPQTGVTDRPTWEALALLHNSLSGSTPLAWLLAEQG